jgi:hypothetical protein
MSLERAEKPTKLPLIQKSAADDMLLPLSSPMRGQSSPLPTIRKRARTNSQPKRVFEVEDFKFLDILSALALSRSILVLSAQSNILSMQSIGQFIVVFIPLGVTIMQLSNTYMTFNNLFLKFLDMVSQSLILFGLAWTVPSVFTTVNGTLYNFAAFLCLARFKFCIVSLIWAYDTLKLSTPAFINCCLSMLPMICWVICYFIDSNSVSFIIYACGVAIDLLVSIYMDFYQFRMM